MLSSRVTLEDLITISKLRRYLVGSVLAKGNELIYKENYGVRVSNDSNVLSSYGSRWFNRVSFRYNVTQGLS